MFDRAENQGVKRQIYIPGIDFNQVAEFQRNKLKHQSHVYSFEPPPLADPNEKKNSPSKDMSPGQKKEFVNGSRLQYLNNANVQITGSYELSLKRRHGAKKVLEGRQNKLRVMTTEAREFYC